MKGWIALVVLGAFFALGGIFALANPFAATLTAASLVGIVFLAGGGLQMWSAFRDAQQPHRLWNGIIGLIGLVAGISLLADPLGGAVSLTLLLALLCLLTGLARLLGAWAQRQSPVFWLLLMSGAASVSLAVLIFTWLPETASTLLGYLLGFELIAEGAALIAIGLLARRRNP